MRNPEFANISHVIRISEDRETMAGKLSEYKKRLREFDPPEMQLDTIYKIEITQELVENGEVDYDAMYESIKKHYGSVNEKVFTNAFRVIEDYVKTGGRHNVGGTGLYGDRKSNEIKH